MHANANANATTAKLRSLWVPPPEAPPSFLAASTRAGLLAAMARCHVADDKAGTTHE